MDFYQIGVVRIDLENVDAYGTLDYGSKQFRISIYRKASDEVINIDFPTKEQRDQTVQALDEKLKSQILYTPNERN